MKNIRDRIRWFAEIGYNSYETLGPQDASEHARDNLGAICKLLDDWEDFDRMQFLKTKFDLSGVEPRIK